MRRQLGFTVYLLVLLSLMGCGIEATRSHTLRRGNNAINYCLVDNQRYEIGEQIPDPCNTCRCEITPTGQAAAVCTQLACYPF